MTDKKPKTDTVDEIRSAIFSSSNFKSTEIELFGKAVEVRQPSVGQLMSLTEEGSDTVRSAAVNAMIAFTYLPGTNQKIFTSADKDGLLNLPMGQWFIDFQTVWADLASIDVGEAEEN